MERGIDVLSMNLFGHKMYVEVEWGKTLSQTLDEIFGYIGWDLRPSDEDCESGQDVEFLPKTVKVVSKGFDDIISFMELKDMMLKIFDVGCYLGASYNEKLEVLNRVRISKPEAIRLLNESLKASESKSVNNLCEFVDQFAELPDEIDILIEDGKYKLLAQFKVSHP